MKKFILLLILSSLSSAAEPKYPLGYTPPTPEVRKKLHAERAKAHGHRVASLAASATPPAEFDVKDMGWAGEPGDQGDCGSCYLYSTVKTATGAGVKSGWGKIDLFRLSFQYGMDYPSAAYFGGCDGGNGTQVIDWMCRNGWYCEADPSQQANELYPAYTAAPGKKRLPAGAKKYTPADWLFITSDQSDRPATIAEMKAALMAYGRVNVAIDASSNPGFMSYTGGVLKTLGNAIDHEVNIRGWSDSRQALLLENQWLSWGGAKAPGDSLAWVAYSAVNQLQDPFAVVASALPPPPSPPATVTVPGVIGSTLAVAQAKLAAVNLSETHTGNGATVTGQTPAAGASASAGSTVSLVLAGVTPPPPVNQPLFTLTFNKPISKGGFVWFNAPTLIPSGSKLQVYGPGAAAGLGESPFGPQADPSPLSGVESSEPTYSPAQDVPYYEPMRQRRGIFRRR